MAIKVKKNSYDEPSGDRLSALIELQKTYDKLESERSLAYDEPKVRIKSHTDLTINSKFHTMASNEIPVGGQLYEFEVDTYIRPCYKRLPF